MEYLEATREVGARLVAGDDPYAAAAALHLALEAWSHLAGDDPAWDQVGLELLDVRGRLYVDEDIAVETEAPGDDNPQLRTAVTGLLEHLAAHHDRLARDERGGLTQRLDHDAGAHQLRRAAAVLA